MELLDKRFSHNEDVAWRVIEGEALLVSPKTSNIFPMDEIGTRIWSLVDGLRTGRDIARMLEEEYDQDLSAIESDLRLFIDDLMKSGLVRTCE